MLRNAVLVGAFDKKFPSLSEASHFFLQITELTLYVPLFGTDVNRFWKNPTVASSIPASANNVFVFLQS